VSTPCVNNPTTDTLNVQHATLNTVITQHFLANVSNVLLKHADKSHRVLPKSECHEPSLAIGKTEKLF
jgi:hypothetical protein